jgi:hypothetical protein
MPRTDPITGCQVLTTGEFFAAEAKREGKGRQGYELMAEMMDDMQAEFARASVELKDDPETILKELRAYYVPEDDSWDWPEGEEPEWVPESIVEVEEAEVDGSFKGSSWMAVVKALCSDGEVRRLKVVYSQFYGDFYEPPSDDINVEVL